ncbi:hypothetical protein [Salinibacterium sp.]|uniref:hypothetical protein n=1 Tax=Salinibacterium sp. TaxID=1915057 RepID=UPI00286C2E59|nr:hypothetical protein [Salinibacterium sp.]
MTAATAPRRMALAFLIGLLGVVTLVGVNACITGGDNRTGSISTGKDTLPIDIDIESFSISGSLDAPLRPGLSSSLDLELKNPYGQRLRIRDLAVAVESVKAPNETAALPCTAGDFATTPATGTIALPARSATTLSALGLDEASWPQVAMLNTSTNQDGCKDATLILSYTATGETR